MNKNIFIVALGLFIISCKKNEGCKKDSDCKGDRICSNDECVEDLFNDTDVGSNFINDDGPNTTEPPTTTTANPTTTTSNDDSADSFDESNDSFLDESSSDDGDIPPETICSVNNGDSNASAGGCMTIHENLQYWMNALEGFWGTDPEWMCVYYQFGYNACGNQGVNASWCPLDSSIMFETSLMDYIGSNFPYGLVSILAHEWAHMNQTILGYEVNNKAMELHADCMSGIFSGFYDASHGDAIYYDAMATACIVGDPYASPWWEPGAHGTCNERQCAFDGGWWLGHDNQGTCDLVVADQICGTVVQNCAKL